MLKNTLSKMGGAVSGKLGKIVYRNLNSVWPHEEKDFTPWLAEEENLSALAAAVGREFQLDKVEARVGPYSADILAKDESGNYIVIENQFNKTNHDHLGKLITYGAALGATVVIWIAEQFTEEHQRAIEWLNEHTDESLSLFAVRPKVIQIDNSLPAVEFEVVERPNDLVKTASIERAVSDASENQRLQFEFWTLFKKRLLEKKVVPSAETPRPQYWFSVPVGRTYFHISNILNTDAGKVGLRVYLHNRVADQALEGLLKDRDAIEQEIGSELQWNPHPDNRDKIISLIRDIDLEDKSSWLSQVDWLVDMNQKFRNAFMPRIRKLDISSSAPKALA